MSLMCFFFSFFLVLEKLKKINERNVYNARTPHVNRIDVGRVLFIYFSAYALVVRRENISEDDFLWNQSNRLH